MKLIYAGTYMILARRRGGVEKCVAIHHNRDTAAKELKNWRLSGMSVRMVAI